MICSDIWLKYHEWYFEIVIRMYIVIDERSLRQFWNITSGIYAKYHVQIMLLFVYTTALKRFVIFTCRYFKLSWNTTALSQSNCRNFSCRSIMFGTPTLSTLIVLEQWPQWRFVKTFPTVCPRWRNLHKTRIVFTNFKIILIFWMYKELIFNY